MPSYDAELRDFIQKFGEDAVPAALANYVNQRDRSKKAQEKSKKERQAVAAIFSKAKSDPALAELLKKHGIAG